jgi:hypothetical protein
MKTDIYTKTVLTIIAICLVVLALGNGGFIPEAQAEIKSKPKYVMVPINADGSINVRVVSIAGHQNVVVAGWKDTLNDSDYAVKNIENNPVPVQNR